MQEKKIYKILGIIPARAGSKGIPAKNKKPLANIPLINYTINAATPSLLSDLVVSTDDDEIADLVTNFGVKVIFRPIDIAMDNTPTLPVLNHVLSTMKEDFDAVMTLQPTSPLRKTIHINESIKLFKDNPDADSLVSVVKVPHNFTPGSIMKYSGKWLVNYSKKDNIYRRQEKPILWARNGAIYITKTNHLNDFIVGGKTLSYEMTKLDSIDIDDIEDWSLAESILKAKSSK